MIRRWIDAIAGMKPAEKNQLIVIACAVTIALFIPLVFLRSWADARFADSMVARGLDRMQRRHSAAANLRPPPASAAMLDKEIADLNKKIDDSRSALKEFQTRFAPVNDAEQQMIKLDISQLADAESVTVDSLVFDPPERNQQFGGRPVMSLRAHCSFQAAQALLRGLSSGGRPGERLSRSVIVVRLSMEAATALPSSVGPRPGQVLGQPQAQSQTQSQAQLQGQGASASPDAIGVRLDLQLAM